jgi:hypothetical protein
MHLIVPELGIITKATRQEKRGRIEQSLSSKKKAEGNIIPSQCPVATVLQIVIGLAIIKTIPGIASDEHDLSSHLRLYHN